MSLKLKGSNPKPEPTCYQSGGSRLGINFELPGKTQLFAHYSFLSHLEMQGDEEINVHFTFGVVRVTGRRLEAIYSLLKEHNLDFARRSEVSDPCRDEIEVTKITFEAAIEESNLEVDK
jgi:hypothetical protein